MSGLVGHAAQVAAFTAAAGDGRLHHAWLLAGAQGIGKARFAEAAALHLLTGAAGPRFETPADDPAARLIEAGSHPDYRRIARLEKEGASRELARSISVAQVRALGPMFATSPSLSPRRVILIDAVDDLERGAANALLKNLEEPPQGTTFLLVSHAPGRLLPTIRSRCRLLRFQPLSAEEVAAVLRQTLDDPAEAATLAPLAGGAPGTALRFAGLDVAALDLAIDRLAETGDPGNGERTRLARALGTKAAQARYELFLERAPARIARAARGRQGPALATAIGAWEKARGLAEGAVRLSLDPQATAFELAGLVASVAPR
ncbi:MAG: DNA polymerase III subunit [Sphingomonas fennica]